MLLYSTENNQANFRISLTLRYWCFHFGWFVYLSSMNKKRILWPRFGLTAPAIRLRADFRSVLNVFNNKDVDEFSWNVWEISKNSIRFLGCSAF